MGALLGAAGMIALAVSMGATPGNYLVPAKGAVELSLAQASTQLDPFLAANFGSSAAALSELHCIAGPKSLADKTQVLHCSARYMAEKSPADALGALADDGAVVLVPDK
jgi:hypothetical protein